jgi:hypothetical protein
MDAADASRLALLSDASLRQPYRWANFFDAKIFTLYWFYGPSCFDEKINYFILV